jgi:cardiolipin synthase
MSSVLTHMSHMNICVTIETISCPRNGVSVRVVYDSVGSLASDNDKFDAMRKAGCEVLEYNPVRWWAGRWAGLNRFNRRDHRKTLVIDRSVAFTGGLNFADHWLPIEQGGDDWKDYMIRIEGPGAELFAQVSSTWVLVLLFFLQF